MGLNSKYVIAPSLQMYFVDKDDGLPLVNGQVFFYKDNTNILKDVFTIVASGSDFTYTALPNPSTLSAVGTFQNASGVDILPYYYPYDSDGNIQLYTVKVYDSLGVLQFTRVGWPNITSSQITSANDVTNFVPNGQFLLHNNIPASSANGFIAGQISQDNTIIAPGGWSFVRSATASTDNISFHAYSSTSIPSGNPRYAVDVATTVAGTSPSRRDLCLKFPGVNTFASTTQSYNFYFEAGSISGSDISNVQIILHKFFGTGGSPSTETFTEITSITLTNNSIKSYNTSILFGSNTSQSLGTNNDDYVELIVRLPPTGIQTGRFTDFALTVNEEILSSFPQQTEAQQLDPSTAGWLPVPSYSGQDLYLPTVLTASGLTFDHSEIGSIIAEGNLTHYSGSLSTLGNKMLADGSQYRYNDYSSLGIPFSRLGDYYIAGGTGGVPQYGTGDNYTTSYINSGATQKLIFTLNKVGSQSAPSDGGTPTGFTFTQLIAGSAGFNFSAYTNGSTLITAVCNAVGSAGSPSSGTSGMTVTSYRNIALTYEVIQITALSASALGNGAGVAKYFQFSSTTTAYYMWFQTATETDPAPGGTGIKVNLDLTMLEVDVAKVISNAMSGFQIYEITCVAASAFTAGSFWKFTANSQIYVPWYTKDGAGTAPIVASSILIPINVASTATAAQVATATQLALNKFYFKVPNLQGLFLRGYDPTGEWDIDYLNRFSISNTLLGSSAGSIEIDQFYNHLHSFHFPVIGNVTDNPKNPAGTKNNPGSDTYATATDTAGGSESRPVNMAVVWAIKY